MRLKLIYLTIGCLMLWGSLRAQSLSTQSAAGQNPTVLINQHLAGDGVLLSNAKFNNSTGNISTAQIGTFTYTGNAFPYHSGLIMTTGNVSVANGPNNSGSSSSAVSPEYVDPQLQPYATSTLHNCSALEFNFVAYSDTFAFNYIFGSEEYEEYVNAGFNDVFAFLLTGRDPITFAPNTTRNVAIVPHSITAQHPTGTPVTIDNVNHLLNTTYYHNNNGGAAVQYDGYTTSLTAEATILACETYTMHLSVGNIGDNAYDSGVFLEEGSFYSPSVQVVEDFQINNNSSTQFGDTIVQNCREVEIHYKLPRKVLQGLYHASIDFMGNAAVGIDYELSYLNGTNWDILNETNNEVYYHADDSVILMHLRMLPSAPCDVNVVKEVQLIVTTIFCDDYYYNGHPDAGRVDTLVYHLKCNPPIELEDTTFKYCHHGDHISVNMTSGANDLLWQWIPASGITTPNAQSSAADISSGRTYQVIAKDRYGCLADTADVEVTIYSQPTIDLHINPENGCAPLPVNLKTLNIPDDCDIIWHLTHEDGTDTIFTSNPFNVTLDNPGYYDVSLWLSTAPGCSDSVSLHNAIHVSDYPHAMLSFSPDEANNGEIVYFYDESTGSDIVSYFWSFGDGGTSTSQNAEHAYHVTTSDNMNVRFLVTNVDGCSDDTTFIVPVVDNFALYIPNSFTPNNDNVNDVFQPIATDVAYYRLELYDRQGNLFFMTEDTDTPWDGTINGKPAPSGVYVWTIQYIRYSNLNQTLLRRGTVTLVR